MTGQATHYYSIREVAKATGLPERTIRDLLDKDRISYVQWQHNAMRRLNDDTLRSLEALGIPVDKAALQRGKNGKNGKSIASSDSRQH